MNNNKKNEFIDIKGLFNQYLKYWYLFAISIIICLFCGYVFAKTHPKENVVNASLLVAQDESTANMLNGLGGLFGTDAYVQDEIYVISSHSLLAKVAKDLKINKTHYVKTGFLTKKLEYPSFPVDVMADSTIVDTLRVGLNFEINVLEGASTADITVKAKNKKIVEIEKVKLPAAVKTDYGIFNVVKTKTYPANKAVETEISINGYDPTAESLSASVNTYIASKKSNVIGLSINTTNSALGVDILNKMMEVYNERGIVERNQRALNTAEFISERIDLVGNELNAVESQIEHYKEGNRLIDIEAEAKVNTELKTEYEAKLVELQTQKEILDMTMTFLTSEANKYDMLPVVSLEMGDRDKSIETYNELILKRITLLTGAKPGNRNIAELDSQIEALRSTIVIAVQRAIRSNSIAIKEAKAQADMAIAKLGNVPTQEREFISLKRQQEVKQALYLFLLERAEETSMMIANTVPKGMIIDKAFVLKDPVGAGTTIYLALGLFIGLLIPMLWLYLKNLLRTKIHGRRDLEKHIDRPVLGEICIDKSGQNLVVTEQSSSSASELFRMVRANLQFVLGNPDDKVVMVTSSSSGEGKSFISTNLAASLALLGKKVVLMGMDIRKPQLANYMGIPASPGLTQFLSNSTVTLSSIVNQIDDVKGLDVIVAGPIPPNPGELMNSPRLAEMFEYLREIYDYIIIDTAPVGLVSDSLNLTQYVDATVFVVRDRVTRIQDLNYVNELVDENRLKRVNLVLNGTEAKKGYGYGYK